MTMKTIPYNTLNAVTKRITVLLLTVCSISLLSSFTRSPQTPAPNGKEIFEQKCARCHGNDGTKGLLRAKNLKTSKLSDAEILTTITNGKLIMPSWKKRLTPEQIQQVATYIKTLRK
jgi:cytochrome c6